MRGRCLATLLVGSLAAGCGGSSSDSTSRLQTQATRICLRADQRVGRISDPAARSELFLKRGSAVLDLELRELRALRASGTGASAYRSALSALSDELAAVGRTIDALEHRQDPVIAFRALEHRLVALERRGDRAWKELGISACAS